MHMETKRIAVRWKLKDGFEEEYKRRHDEIWPELLKLIKDSGISDYSIFLDRKQTFFLPIRSKPGIFRT